MNLILPTRMTVDEFLRWSRDQESGRYELEGGRIVAMQAENAGHVRTKTRIFRALESAISQSGLPFYAMPDGMTVRISDDRGYEPDALVAPLPAVPDNALEVPDPIAVFEVVSPTPASVRRDLVTKLSGYALVPSIEHYVVIDPEERIVLHFRRRGDHLAPPDAPVEGVLRLDPPGLEVPVESMLITLS